MRSEEAAIARGKDRLEALRGREAQAENERREIQSQHDALSTERNTLEGEIVALESDEAAKRAEADSDESRLAENATALAGAETRSAERQAAASQAHAAIASAEATLAGHDRRSAEMTARLDKVKLERAALEDALVEHRGKLRALEARIEQLRAGKVASAEDLEHAEARLSVLRVALVKRERAIDESRSELSHVLSRWLAVSDLHDRFEGVGEGPRALMGTGDPSLLGLVGDRIEASAEMTHALAGLLGDRLNDVVTTDVGRALELLETLARDGGGRAGVVPAAPSYTAGAGMAVSPDHPGVVGRIIDSLRFASEDQSLLRALVGDALVVQDVGSALALTREHDVSVPLVTLSGTVVFPDGRIVGGAGDEIAAGRLDEKRELRELGEQIAHLDVVASDRLTAHQALRGEIAETQATLDQARTQAHADELATATAERDLHAASSAIVVVEKRLSVLMNEADELTRHLDEGRVERENAEATLEHNKRGFAVAEQALEAARVDVAAHRAQVDDQRTRLTEARVRLAASREKLAAVRGTIGRLDRSVVELDERTRRLEDEAIEAARTWGETAGQIAIHRETLVTALDELRDAQQSLAEARDRYEALKIDLGEREVALKDIRAQAEAMRESLTEAERSLHTRTMALEHLLESIADKFRGLHLPAVIGDYHLRPPPDEEHQSRITELAGLIERMGSVNLDAMREHQEAEQRFTFYTTQKADLEKALADLEKAIAQMNRESKRLFAETFEAVNAKFQELFPKMFRGGRASLRLTNPDDMLETGIDILAQPPGKKLSSIELMSGGEKALTAVSLIFAIFQIKPSPFCILDEVDAPLDETNVARYNEMIRSMTHSSQFILITHIKRTMQLADVLYGVTMQESGVSRLVSVNMTNVVDNLATTKAPRRDAQKEEEVEEAKAGRRHSASRLSRSSFAFCAQPCGRTPTRRAPPRCRRT